MSAALHLNQEKKRRGWTLKPNKPGERRGGRPKGGQNHVNRDIKEMVVTALSKAGGVDYLVQCAHRQPVAFLGLVGRVLPLQLAATAADGTAIPISFEWAPAQPTIEAKAEPQIVADAELVTDGAGG